MAMQVHLGEGMKDVQRSGILLEHEDRPEKPLVTRNSLMTFTFALPAGGRIAGFLRGNCNHRRCLSQLNGGDFNTPWLVGKDTINHLGTNILEQLLIELRGLAF